MEFVCTQVDFLGISETKLHSSFPTTELNLQGVRTPYRKVITARSQGLLVYVNGNTSSSSIISICDCSSDIQILTVKMDLKKQKWLVVAKYAPPSQCKSYFIAELTKVFR